VLAVRRPLEAPPRTRDQLVLAHLPHRAMPPDLVPFVDEIAVHARAATGAVREREGRADMRQINHVLLLTTAGRTVLPGEEAALADAQDTAHPADREAGLLCIDEGELHPWRVLSDQWRSPATSLPREEGRGFLGYRHSPGKRSPGSFSDPAQMLQDRILTPKLRRRPVPVSHRTPPGSSVGALHKNRASPSQCTAKRAVRAT
jgi:hypothetical protein